MKMLISEKQKSMSWQIKTKDGQYYQPDSLQNLYTWIFEARLCPDDFIFSARQKDWILLVNMPELTYCFWQILCKDATIYGPVSTGEFKQLYENNQVNSFDKITPCGREEWKELKDIPSLFSWVSGDQLISTDYVQLIEKIHIDYISKEQTGKVQADKKEDSNQKKYVEELESTKTKLEKEIGDKNRILEESLEEANKYKEENNSILEEIKHLRLDVLEKANIIEQFNKQNAQVEVAHTLKDDEINQLRSNIKLLQEEILSLHEKGDIEKKSVSDVSSGLNAAIDELKDENKKFINELNEHKNIILGKEEIITGLKNTIDNIVAEREELNKKVFSIEAVIAEKENVIASLNAGVSESKKQLIEDVQERDSRIAENLKNISMLEEEVGRLNHEIEKTNNSTAEKDREIFGLINEKEALQIVLNDRNDRMNSLQNAISDKDNEINNLKDAMSEIVKEKERILEGAEVVKRHIEGLTAEINKTRNEIENLNRSLSEKESIIQYLENERNALKQEITSKRDEYEAGKRNLEVLFEKKRLDLENEINQKTMYFNESIKSKEGELSVYREVIAEKESQIEAQRKEVARLQECLVAQDNKWQEKIRELDSEVKETRRQAESEKEAIRTEMFTKMSVISEEKEELVKRNAEYDTLNKKYAHDLEIFRNEAANKNRIIESIKEDMRKQEEIYEVKRNELEQELAQIKESAGVLFEKGRDLENKIQEGIIREEELRGNVSLLNEELKNKKEMIRQMEIEREELLQAKSGLLGQLEETKRSLENAEEENRASQRQFYMEKQKVTKEYNETINKLEKLQKRTQLEREIQDRSKMKSELERLYNLLRDNFLGIERGVSEIQSSYKSLAEDIDNKNLSLKYLTETEKRDGKKGQFPKSDSTDESDSPKE
jgi:chromosome segregation ATPase